jgi:uncharacterized protein (TIGR02597 family)
MKNCRIFAVIVFLSGGVSLQAQTTINTSPLGMVAFPIPHGATTYLSLPLEAAPTYAGAISATTANSITVADNPAPWTSGELSAAAQPYFVKFLTGPETGRIVLVTANSASTLTLDTTDHTSQTTPLLSSPSSAFDVQIGNTFEVFPGETLGTFFGTGTTQDPLSYLVPGSNVVTADVVTVFTTTTAPSSSYFFDNKAGAGYWTRYLSTANSNNTILYPYSTLAITRQTLNGDTTVPVMGTVTDIALLVKTLSRATTYTSSQYPANITLANLGLGSNWTKCAYPGNPSAPNLPVGCDNLNVWNPSAPPGHFDTYYQLSDSTWRKYPNKTTDVSSFVIPAGSAICITKSETVSGATSYLQPALPYTLN